ncbi:MAG TPA: flagellar hook protein FlgE [Pseudomonas sp.]|nr:flagellar hook protein FlgE [Pseudomonas sp.]
MSFNVALSGLAAANKDLAVTGNNIANVATTGFKASRAEFADVYSASILGTGGKVAGAGVRTAAIAQQFTQGNINHTGNSLDLAINGNGFFALSAQGQIMYTRAGEFGTDKDGYIINSSGFRLQGYDVGVGGQILQGKKVDLRVDTSNVQPKPTSLIRETINLDSTATIPGVTPFNPDEPESFNWSTSVPLYDSLGNSHTMTHYFVKGPIDAVTGNATWTMYTLVNGRNPTDPSQAFDPANPDDTSQVTELEFDSSGRLVLPTDGSFSLSAADGNEWVPGEITNPNTNPPTWGPNGAIASLNGVTVNFSDMTQYNAVSAVTSQNQDGYATGQLSGLTIDETGNMFAAFTNGQSKLIGQVMLVNFSNPQGLKPVGGTAWVETYASGVPIEGMAKTGTFGAIQAGALEESNVDLTAQLVQLIKAQSNYQANAKTVTTESTVMQTTINMT